MTWNRPMMVIARNPPDDGNEWDCQCARCGSSMTHQYCWACGGEGCTAPGELYEMDPLWYDEDDSEPCHQCGGTGGWMVCLSGPHAEDPDGDSWCQSHPMPGRESVESGATEWFVTRRAKASR